MKRIFSDNQMVQEINPPSSFSLPPALVVPGVRVGHRRHGNVAGKRIFQLRVFLRSHLHSLRAHLDSHIRRSALPFPRHQKEAQTAHLHQTWMKRKKKKKKEEKKTSQRWHFDAFRVVVRQFADRRGLRPMIPCAHGFQSSFSAAFSRARA